MPTLKTHGRPQASPLVHGFPQVQKIVMGERYPGLVLQLEKACTMKNLGLIKALELLPHFPLGLVLPGAKRQDCLLQVGAIGVGILPGGSTNKVELLLLLQMISALSAESGARIHYPSHAAMYVAALSVSLRSNKLQVKNGARSAKRPCIVYSALSFPDRCLVFLRSTYCCPLTHGAL
mmetsp:Transcript_8299/g.51676  ORF Transcript_8299/g.51676 Transcript_8299/m.51676 type:complete len:178 (+) Transcript_8299:5193-5726(+)